MPNPRRFAQRTARRVAFLVAVASLAVLLTSLASTQIGSACPLQRPVPLRALYMNSDLVVVGRFGGAIQVELATPDGEMAIPEGLRVYKRYLMRSDLNVVSTVKGVGDQSVVHVYHWGWTDDGDVVRSPNPHSDRQKLLVFLTRRENGAGYEVADNSYGVKSLADADLKIYLARLDELALILQQEKPDPARIVEWLVRCVEEKATRWDGLEELTMSHYALLASKSKEVVVDEAEVTGDARETVENEAGEDSDQENAEKSSDSTDTSTEITSEQIVILPTLRRGFDLEADPDFMRLLTAEQKSRLANVLFNAKPLTYLEIPLIELVTQWNDSRVVPYIMSQLRGFVEHAPPEADFLVRFMSETLKDEEISRLAEKYSTNGSYNDEAEDAVSDDESAVETGSAADAQESIVEESEEEAAESVADDEGVVGNDKQKRIIRLQRFIARAESVLAR